jgi:NAD(P)-dependent dehydrogenase (short-subunit alcohol dehydrogenase family)
MRDRGRGCIVALADIAAVRPWTDYGPYSVAKAGGIALTSTLAAVWAPRVRVNAIAPGPILSPSDGDSAAYRREIDRTLARRSGTVEEIASAVCFLVENDFVTGTVLPVDGGRLLAGDV